MNNKAKFELPDWAWDICEKYRLHERSDEPLGGVVCLLMDAAHDLEKAGLGMAEADAATPDMIRLASDASAMIEDALRLASICRAAPTAHGQKGGQ